MGTTESGRLVEGVAESIRSILTESRVAPEDIKVISVSSQAPAVLPMTKEGEPLHDALIWMDRRSTKELEILEEKVGTKKVYEITGNVWTRILR